MPRSQSALQNQNNYANPSNAISHHPAPSDVSNQRGANRQPLIDQIVGGVSTNPFTDKKSLVNQDGESAFNKIVMNSQQYLNTQSNLANNVKHSQLAKKYQIPNIPLNLDKRHKAAEKGEISLRVTEHLIKFSPIQAKEFITKKPVIRNFKEESDRLMHEQFNPERLKQKQLDMERMAIADELEVQDFFKNNADLLDI